MPLWDTDNTCTPVPTLPCTNTHTHKELIRIRQNFTILYGYASLTDAGNRREKYISQVSLAAVTIVFLTCSSTGSMFCSTPCLAVNHTDRNSWMPNRCVCIRAYAWKKKKKILQRTEGLPKRAFIFCLSSRVMRTHASDRVSFTICRVEERRRQESRVVERYCLVWSLCGFSTVKYRPQLKASEAKFLHQMK